MSVAYEYHRKRRRKRDRLYLLLLLCGVAVLCFGATYLLSVVPAEPEPLPDRRPTALPTTPSRPGDTSVSECNLCLDNATFDKLTDAAVHGDMETIQLLAAMGKVKVLSSGTRVQVMGSAGFLKKRVRVLSGSHSGSVGIVAMEKIH